MPAGTGSFGLTGNPARLIVKRLWPTLLTTSERLLGAGEHGVAVIVAATACEVVVETAMAKASAADNYLFTYALKKKEHHEKYNRLTGDNINNQPFWNGYLQLVEDRNKAVHAGDQLDRESVQADIDAARRFVEHVAQHNGL
jgi:hypothetical protein